MTQRYSLLRDNDGHDYLIPAEQVDEFYRLLGIDWSDNFEACVEFMQKFGHMSFGSAPSTLTFIDPHYLGEPLFKD